MLSLGVAMFLERFNALKVESMMENSDLVDFINSRGIAIDLRSSADYKNGHIVGTKNIPYEQILSDKVFLNKNKGKDLVLICDKGRAANVIMKRLNNEGFKSVKCLNGGYDAWVDASLPVVLGK